MNTYDYSTPSKQYTPPTYGSPPTPPATPPRHRRPQPQQPTTPSPAPPPPPIPSHKSRPPPRATRPPQQPPQRVVEEDLAAELYSRLQQQAQESLTISKFASLVARLNDGRNRKPAVRQGLITDFADGYAAGKFTSKSKGFNRPKHATRAAREKLTTYPTGRGILAEITIKEQLDADGVLLVHTDGQDLAEVVGRAMVRAREMGREVYVDCGLVACPGFEEEYEGWGWARPGVRWNGFIPDLIAVTPNRDGGCTFEVIEIKYSAREELTVWPNYKVQAIFYHLAVTKLLRPVRGLQPSHQVTIWHSRDYYSPEPIPSTLALRTNLAFVEELLFRVLPTWLSAVRKAELAALGGVRVPVMKPIYVVQPAPPAQLAVPAALKPGGPTAPYTAYVAPVPSPPHTPPRTVRGPRAPAYGALQHHQQAQQQPRPSPSPPARPAATRPQARPAPPPPATAPVPAPKGKKDKKKGPFRRAVAKIRKLAGKLFD